MIETWSTSKPSARSDFAMAWLSAERRLRASADSAEISTVSWSPESLRVAVTTPSSAGCSWMLSVFGSAASADVGECDNAATFAGRQVGSEAIAAITVEATAPAGVGAGCGKTLSVAALRAGPAAAIGFGRSWDFASALSIDASSSSPASSAAAVASACACAVGGEGTVAAPATGTGVAIRMGAA